nr:globoside alpha-1,3-N-acetylgalactosaminyltransferase 1-like [Salvelinus alpinus]
MKFHQRWGAEALSQLVAAVHLSYYYESRDKFLYERRPASLSFVPLNEGDFYYDGAVFGGTVEEVHKLTRTCQEHLDRDRVNGIEAAWQEENHLNRYRIYNKPTRLLSRVHIWDYRKSHDAPEIKVIRLASVMKNNVEIRQCKNVEGQ